MSIIRRVILFVLLPVLLVMIGAATLYHFYGYSRARQSSQKQLAAAGQLTSQLVQRQLDRFEESLQTLMSYGLEEFHMYAQVGLLDEAEDSRLSVENALERLANDCSDILRIECYDPQGERFIAVVDQRRVLTPRNVQGEAWFVAAKSQGRFVGFADRGQVRIALAQTASYAETPISVATVVVDLSHLAAQSAEFATRHLQHVDVAIVDQDSDIQFGGEALTMVADVFEALAGIDSLHANVVVRQARDAALDEFHASEQILFGAMAIVTCFLLVLVAVGTRTVVKGLQEANRKTDLANEKLQHANEQLRCHAQTLEEHKRDLQRLNEQLHRSNKDLDDFAYIVSHDLKEPLRGISMYAKFVADGYTDKLDDEAREYLDGLTDLCRRMDNLIETLLHFSRLGRVELAFGPVDLNELVTEVTSMLDAVLQEQRVELRILDNLPTVTCDAIRVRELVHNLIANAVKYNDKSEKWVEVGVRQNGTPRADNQQPVFYVRDNGIGIPERHLEAVFNMFRRLHGRDKFGGGTGAGLTFVKQIAERHGGRAWAESQEGEGTTICFTLG